MPRWRPLLVALLLAAAAAACTGADEPAADAQPPDTAASEPPAPTAPPIEGGTVVVGAGAAPGGLNPWTAPGRDTAALVTRPVLAPLWRVLPDGTSEPWLLAGEPTVDGGGDGRPFTVTYELRDDAVWSDGTAIDGRDVLFTLSVCRRLLAEGLGDPVCGAVDLTRSSADGPRATVAFSRPVASWRSLLAALPVLPEHLLADRDPATAWTDDLPVSSGPFEVESYQPGERLVLQRNDRWWGEPPPLDRLVLTFGADEGVDAVLDGRVDVVAGDASLPDVERARAVGGVRVAVAPGGRWDAVDFNVAAPPVARAAVRRALAAALDRTVVRDELIAPIAPTVPLRDELLRPPPEPADAESTTAPGDPDPAADLAQAGCARDDGDVLVCDGERMEITLARAGGRWRHRIIGEYVAQQLGRVGVRVDVAARSAAATPDGWDLRLVTVASAPDALGEGDRWRCDVPANTQAFCRPTYDDLLDRARRAVDAEARAPLLDDAERVLARARPTVPLFAVPAMLVTRDDVRGPTVNTGPWGLTWNTEAWARTAR